jgi:hypothetical protein
MEEIMFAGSTFNSIASGKRIYSPEMTPFDVASTKSQEAFATAVGERTDAMDQIQVQGSLQRQTTDWILHPLVQDAIEPELNVTNRNCTDAAKFAVYGLDMSCHVMTLTDQDNVPDTVLNKQYFPLIQLKYMQWGMRLRDKAFYSPKTDKNLVTYDPRLFPSWCGKSASFSFWWDPKGATANPKGDGGYVLSKYKDVSRTRPYWSVYIGDGGVVMYGTPFSALVDKYSMMAERRHIVVTANHLTDIICAYMDGSEINCARQEAGFVGELDCGAFTYIGLNHRLPGAWQPEVVIQDWRYYQEALSPEEVKKLAFESVDEDGKNMRSCALLSEVADTDWIDSVGNGCAWYQEKKKTVHNICSTDEIKTNCPVACASNTLCWGSRTIIRSYSIWNRIMHLKEESLGAGVVCVREGVDAVAQCRKNNTVRGNLDWLWPTEFKPGGADIAVGDCDVLMSRIDPYCSFPAPWTQDVKAEIMRTGGVTVEFWWQALAGTKIPRAVPLAGNQEARDPETMRRIVLFSKMSPPTVFAEIIFSQTLLVQITMYSTCGREQVEDVEVYGTPQSVLEHGVWYRTAFVLGAISTDGKRGLRVFHGSSAGSFDLAAWSDTWCFDDADDFIQGLQLPGGVLMSPIEITPSPLYAMEIQSKFYEQKPQYRVSDHLRGPATDDKTRMTEPVSYTRHPFAYPVSLVSPPIVLQSRVEKTEVCKNELGAIFQRNLWKDTISGVTCEFPYRCDDEMMNRSTSLMSCSTSTVPPEFFGKAPFEIGGKMQFHEFLQSVTDALILVRNGTQYQTSAFIDPQTTSVSVIMVAFSPEHGIASTIAITASFSADVSVDYSVEHFQSLEGAQLEKYKWIVIFGFALAFIILVEKLATIVHKDFKTELPPFVVDLVVQVVLPVIYFSVRYSQVLESRHYLTNSVGPQGLGGVPWSSRSVSLDNKIEQFFAGLSDLQARIRFENLMAMFYFMHAAAALFRLIYQTSAHPRTAILVNTISESFVDLWHFLILFIILNAAFIALGMSQFAGEKTEFATISNSFETLWEMLLGSMLSSGAIPSSTWSHDPFLLIYLMLYNLLFFMLMLNFIIAIIVEAYMKVVKGIEEMESDQEFFTDVTSVVIVSIKSFIHRWPGHQQLISAIGDSKMKSVDYLTLRQIFPEWDRRGMKHFLHYYGRYGYMSSEHNTEISEADQIVNRVVTEVEDRVSVMFGAPIPTPHERLIERKRLEAIATAKRVPENQMKGEAHTSTLSHGGACPHKSCLVFHINPLFVFVRYMYIVMKLNSVRPHSFLCIIQYIQVLQPLPMASNKS